MITFYGFFGNTCIIRTDQLGAKKYLIGAVVENGFLNQLQYVKNNGSPFPTEIGDLMVERGYLVLF
jgi:hypothetical protein